MQNILIILLLVKLMSVFLGAVVSIEVMQLLIFLVAEVDIRGTELLCTRAFFRR